MSLFLSALLAAFAAGIPDIFAASALVRAPPGKILQTVASGLLGKASYESGAQSMALGLVLQVAMSFVIALVFNIAMWRVAGIRAQPLLFGALYGVVIFVVMNFVVVPLSRAYPKPQWTLKAVVAMGTRDDRIRRDHGAHRDGVCSLALSARSATISSQARGISGRTLETRGEAMERKKASDFPQELLNLFDGYVHGEIDRRAFLDGGAEIRRSAA